VPAIWPEYGVACQHGELQSLWPGGLDVPAAWLRPALHWGRAQAFSSAIDF